MRCIGLPAIAAEAAKLARTDMALAAADCLLLGQPKTTLLSDPTIARVPGALVNLLHEGRPREFLLVAHIDGDRWFCHDGGPTEDPFNAKGLCIKDIALDGCQKAGRRKSEKTSDVGTMALSSPKA